MVRSPSTVVVALLLIATVGFIHVQAAPEPLEDCAPGFSLVDQTLVCAGETAGAWGFEAGPGGSYWGACFYPQVGNFNQSAMWVPLTYVVPPPQGTVTTSSSNTHVQASYGLLGAKHQGGQSTVTSSATFGSGQAVLSLEIMMHFDILVRLGSADVDCDDPLWGSHSFRATGDVPFERFCQHFYNGILRDEGWEGPFSFIEYPWCQGDRDGMRDKLGAPSRMVARDTLVKQLHQSGAIGMESSPVYSTTETAYPGPDGNDYPAPVIKSPYSAPDRTICITDEEDPNSDDSIEHMRAYESRFEHLEGGFVWDVALGAGAYGVSAEVVSYSSAYDVTGSAFTYRFDAYGWCIHVDDFGDNEAHVLAGPYYAAKTSAAWVDETPIVGCDLPNWIENAHPDIEYIGTEHLAWQVEGLDWAKALFSPPPSRIIDDSVDLSPVEESMELSTVQQFPKSGSVELQARSANGGGVPEILDFDVVLDALVDYEADEINAGSFTIYYNYIPVEASTNNDENFIGEAMISAGEDGIWIQLGETKPWGWNPTGDGEWLEDFSPDSIQAAVGRLLTDGYDDDKTFVSIVSTCDQIGAEISANQVFADNLMWYPQVWRAQSQGSLSGIAVEGVPTSADARIYMGYAP